MGPGLAPDERNYTIAQEEEGVLSKYSPLHFFELIHKSSPEIQPAEHENLVSYLDEQIHKFQDELPAEKYSAWIPLARTCSLESLSQAFWKLVQYHMPNNILSKAYGSRIDDPDDGPPLLANMIINLTCQWLSVNDSLVDNLADTSFLTDINGMEAQIDFTEHFFIWLHLANMFNFNLRILSPKHGTVLTVDAMDGVREERGKGLRMYVMEVGKMYYALLPETSPVMSSSLRRTTDTLVDKSNIREKGGDHR